MHGNKNVQVSSAFGGVPFLRHIGSGYGKKPKTFEQDPYYLKKLIDTKPYLKLTKEGTPTLPHPHPTKKGVILKGNFLYLGMNAL